RMPHQDGGPRNRRGAEHILDDHEIRGEPREHVPSAVEQRLEPHLEWVPGARPDDPGPEHSGDPTPALERRIARVGQPRIESDGPRTGAARDGGGVDPAQAAPCASNTSSGMSKFA